ncbi:ABC transporter permease [Natronospora cellulosivora (SeqCode)]
MSLYLEYIKKIFQLKLTYRFNFIFSILTSVLWVYIQVNVWKALFVNQATVSGVSLDEMISFVILNLFISGLTNTYIGQNLGEAINKGDIANSLIKPLNIKFYFIAEDFGDKLFKIIFSIIPTCLLAAFFWGFKLPSLSLNLVIFILSLINAIVIMYSINYILGLLAFWLENSWYVPWYLSAFEKLFAGSLVPLWFYPDILYNISRFLPFRLVSFDPINIYLERISISESLNVLFMQIVWIITLLLLEKIIWYQAQKKIIIFGG